MTPLICTTHIGKLCFMKKKFFVQNVAYLECCNSEFCFKETVCGVIAIILLNEADLFFVFFVTYCYQARIWF